MKTRVLCLAFLLLNLSVYAQDKSLSDEVGFRSDNDAYLAFGQDQYYTNGLFITYRRAVNQSAFTRKINKLIWELELGQKMYTPSSADVKFIEEVDRPFAAYLYAGANIHLLYNSESTLKFGLQAGVIGPKARGRETQEFLHNTFGFYEVEGWEYQVNNEFGLNSQVEFNHVLHRDSLKKSDFILNTYANLGSTYSGAGAGVMFRAGKINQLFQSVASNSIISQNPVGTKLNTEEIYFYARPMLNVVLYDASIKGPMFQDKKGPVTYEPKPLVFSQDIGLAYASARWSLDFHVTIKSRELKSRAGGHQYGSVSVFRRF